MSTLKLHGQAVSGILQPSCDRTDMGLWLLSYTGSAVLPLSLADCAVAQVVRLSRQVPGFLEQLQAAAAAYERQRSLTRQALEDLNLPRLSWQHRPDLEQVCCSAVPSCNACRLKVTV